MANDSQIVVAGCVCLDIIPGWPAEAALGDLAPGKLLEVGPATVAAGGAVSNTGLALHRLGLGVELVGKVGDDAIGQMTLDLFSRLGPRLADAMIIAPGQRSSYTVVINPPGSDRMFLHYPGPNHTFSADDIDYSAVVKTSTRIFHFGYPPLMRRMFDNGGAELAATFRRVRQLGLTTSLDMVRIDPATPAGRVDWPALLSRVLKDVDLFLPSLDEMLFIFDRGLLADIENADLPSVPAAAGIARIRLLADRLLAMGCAVVALKLGADGLYLRTTADADRLGTAGRGFGSVSARNQWLDRELLAPCFAVEVAGTTGAGDCTIAGFLAGVLAGQTPEQAVTSAVAVGASSVERPDATSGVPAWPVVARRIQSDWKRMATRVELPGWRYDQRAGVWIGR